MKMKKIVLILSGVIVLASCGDSSSATTEAAENVEVGNKTTIVVNPVYDAGEVVKGEIITGIFTVKNTGKYPLVVSEVKGSCTCTVAEKPEKPIAPGSEAIIKAEVDTEKTSTGDISKSVRIVANTEPSVTEVVIKAKVKN
jgi:hypothetical protein